MIEETSEPMADVRDMYMAHTMTRRECSGRTGGHIIDRALSKGHTLTALVRDPTKLTPQAGLTAVLGTPANRGAVDGRD